MHLIFPVWADQECENEASVCDGTVLGKRSQLDEVIDKLTTVCGY